MNTKLAQAIFMCLGLIGFTACGSATHIEKTYFTGSSEESSTSTPSTLQPSSPTAAATTSMTTTATTAVVQNDPSASAAPRMSGGRLCSEIREDAMPYLAEENLTLTQIADCGFELDLTILSRIEVSMTTDSERRSEIIGSYSGTWCSVRFDQEDALYSGEQFSVTSDRVRDVAYSSSGVREGRMSLRSLRRLSNGAQFSTQISCLHNDVSREFTIRELRDTLADFVDMCVLL